MSAEAIPESTTSARLLGWGEAWLPSSWRRLRSRCCFGALAVENGFTVAEATLMSATVYGGASQMVGIELFGQKIAPWLVVL